MKFAFAVLSVAALGACQMSETTSMAKPDGPMTVGTQGALDQFVSGKTVILGSDARRFVIDPNGTLSGSWDGKPLVGTYEMRDGFFCRELQQGPGGASPEDCQLFVLDGDQLSVTRDRGNGGSFTYTIL